MKSSFSFDFLLICHPLNSERAWKKGSSTWAYSYRPFRRFSILYRIRVGEKHYNPRWNLRFSRNNPYFFRKFMKNLTAKKHVFQKGPQMATGVRIWCFSTPVFGTHQKTTGFSFKSENAARVLSALIVLFEFSENGVNLALGGLLVHFLCRNIGFCSVI